MLEDNVLLSFVQVFFVFFSLSSSLKVRMNIFDIRRCQWGYSLCLCSCFEMGQVTICSELKEAYNRTIFVKTKTNYFKRKKNENDSMINIICLSIVMMFPSSWMWAWTIPYNIAYHTCWCIRVKNDKEKEMQVTSITNMIVNDRCHVNLLDCLYCQWN
jgi:hypothetical protein